MRRILSWATLHLVACIHKDNQPELHFIEGKASGGGAIRTVASSFLDTAIQPRLTLASDPTYMAKEIDLLQAQIEATRATEQALDTENGALQKELDGWKSAGQRVAQRESHIVDMIRQLRGEQKASTHSQKFVSLLEQKIFSSESERPGSPSAMLYAVVVFAFCASILYNVAFSDTRKDKWTCGTWSRCVKPIWRQVGMGRYVLEVSEIQAYLPDSLASGDLCVTMQAGNGKPLWTKSADVLAGSNLLAYRDIFTFDLRSSDGPCTFSVADRDTGPGSAREPLALLALPSQEILRLAQKDRGEYFRFDLHSLKGCSEKPYLAMRIRDITAMVPKGADQAVQQGGVMYYRSNTHCSS